MSNRRERTIGQKLVSIAGKRYVSIPLTRGVFTIVNISDAQRLCRYKWFALKCKYGFYAARNKCRKNHKKGGIVLMHREIKSRDGFLTDHKNRNSLDNRRSNLRIATRSQNNANSKARRNSFPRGVYQSGNRFIAGISQNGRFRFLGRFNTAIEAAEKFNQAAKATHGKFAVINP